MHMTCMSRGTKHVLSELVSIRTVIPRKQAHGPKRGFGLFLRKKVPPFIGPWANNSGIGPWAKTGFWAIFEEKSSPVYRQKRGQQRGQIGAK